jgi:monovalent cation:H+ antiporter-2, CPA2 family
MEIPILNVLGIMLGLSVVVLVVFRRFKLPTIIGFIITGVLVGPSAFSLVKADHDIEIMAELGIILLLFIIGLEFSLKTLSNIKKAVLLGGTLQVGLTILIPGLAFFLLGFPISQAVFIGFLLALSSTAIVLKMLSDRGEINAPHGKIALAILIFQDIIVVPMMLFTPLIAGAADNIWTSLTILLLKAVGVIFVVIVSAKYLVPRLLYIVAKTRNQELFLLTVITICIATAIMTSYVGLSLALGAFLAGLIISESEYSHQAISHVLPFREIFTSIFFISIGMLLDVNFLLSHIIPVLGFTVLILLIKFIIASWAGLTLNYTPRIALTAGIMIFQVGEFSFILSRVGIEYGLMSDIVNQYFLSISIISMALTPFIIPKADLIISKILHLPISKPIHAFSKRMTVAESDEIEEELEDHMIIVGYGINGRNVARAARYANIPYIILELNADTVKKEKEKGENILYGDAINQHILEHAHVQKARLIVVAISDADATRKIISSVRSLTQSVYLIIRTRFISDIEEYILLGADEVIPEEFETSIQIFSRVLRRFYVPFDEIQSLIQEIREDNYDFLRPEDHELKGIRPSFYSGLNVLALRVNRSDNQIVGKSFGDANIRNKYGVNIIAVQRGDKVLYDVDAETIITNDDVLYVAGTAESVRSFARKINIDLS